MINTFSAMTEKGFIHDTASGIIGKIWFIYEYKTSLFAIIIIIYDNDLYKFVVRLILIHNTIK